jgi:hypothetical protein
MGKNTPKTIPVIPPTKNMKRHPVLNKVALGVIGLGCISSSVFADATQGTVYYTRYASAERVNSVDYKYDGTTFSVANTPS